MMVEPRLYKYNTCLLASILKRQRFFFHKVHVDHTSLSSLMFMMAEIISNISRKVVVCMLLGTRDTYPTKSDHIIILMYCDVFHRRIQGG